MQGRELAEFSKLSISKHSNPKGQRLQKAQLLPSMVICGSFQIVHCEPVL